uniref:Putative LOC101165203 [Oryzias latipes] n=1 Tax=Lepeophtheirus salmonis TaxID=72036 RepID=A0A0K2V4D5_LEPSM
MESTFCKLKRIKINSSFNDMMKAYISSTIVVLEGKYIKYFELDNDNLSERLKEEITLARCHNMAPEELIDMFSAIKNKSSSETMDYISCGLSVSKNGTIHYLEKRWILHLEKTS